MIINPKKTSYHSIRRLYNNGSSTDAKNAPQENIASVTETFDILIALKKNIQCAAINPPTKISFKISFRGRRNSRPVPRAYIKRKVPASNIIFNTYEISRLEIRSPTHSTPPQIN